MIDSPRLIASFNELWNELSHLGVKSGQNSVPQTAGRLRRDPLAEGFEVAFEVATLDGLLESPGGVDEARSVLGHGLLIEAGEVFQVAQALFLQLGQAAASFQHRRFPFESKEEQTFNWVNSKCLFSQVN